MRNDALVRVLSLLRTLQDGGQHSLSDLARTFGVSERTIRRDFEALSAAGYPICRAPESGDGQRGHWWLG